jgi:uncharacterized protein (TIGR02145 family)
MKTKKIFLGILFIVGTMLCSAFGGSEKDLEENTCKTVKIGNQEWMAENLNTSKFRNGDLISEAKTRKEWQQAGREGKPVWSYYGNDPAKGSTYGKLYNWYAVNDPRGLAPPGWHVPSDAEWTQLMDYLGGEDIAGTKIKSSSGWNENGNGTNNSQFSGLPGGACADDGYLGSVGYLGVWWSSTEDTSYYYDSDAYAWYRYLYFSKDNVIRYAHSKGNGFSVRCLRD